MMHSIRLTLLLCLFGFLSYAQEWKNGLKDIDHPTLYDYQRVFNTYWESRPEETKWKKGSGYKQFKRFEWFWGPRVNKKGEFPQTDRLDTEWRNYLSRHGNTANVRTSENTWTSLGPSSISSGNGGVGRINTIAFHPTLENTFWIGSPSGGLWKTTDGGSTWSTTFDDMPSLGVSDIAIHPTDPNIMYLATGDADSGSLHAVFGGSGNRTGDTNSIGILKSTDGGNTWTSVLDLNVEDGYIIRRLFLDPDYPDYIYAASNGGILLSADAGASWDTKQSGHFKDIERHPTDPNTMYASSFGSDAQLFISTDGGFTWNQATQFTGVGRINIEVTPAEPDFVGSLCAAVDGWGLHSVQVSSDKGQSFTTVHDANSENLLGYEVDGSGTGGQGSYDLAFAVDPTSSSNLYVGGVTNWMTKDGGSSWSLSNYWTDDQGWTQGASVEVVHADKHFLTFHPLNSSVLFECNDGGVWKSTNEGSTWINLTDGLEISQFYDIDCSQSDANIIVGGFQDNGSKLHTSEGWSEASGGDGMACQIDDTNELVYTSYVEGVIYRSSDGVNIDAVISENLPGGQLGGEWLTPFILDPETPSTIYAGYDEVYKSTDMGESWSQLTSFEAGENLYYVEIQPENTDILYAGTYSVIMMSTDGGNNWSDISAGLPVDQANISRIIPAWDTDIYVTLSGYVDGEKVYHSEDNGTTWTNITKTGLPNVPVNCMAVDKRSGDLYLGTDLGVYINNGTTSWVRYSASLPNVVVSDLDIQYASNKLRAATFGRGLWEVELNSIPANNAPAVVNQSFAIDEHSENGAVVGTLEFSDLDDDALTITFEGSTTEDAFAIDETSGEITVNNSTLLDFETTESFDYTVVVNDSKTTTNATVTINLNDIDECQNVAIEASATIVNSDEQEATGSIQLAITGGTEPYTYDWSNGSTDKDQANLSPGTYTVTITDAFGCGKTISYTIEILIVASINTEDLFTIYPNPSKGIIEINHLESLNNETLKIYSIEGKLLKKFQLRKESTTIDPGLPPGIYHLRVGQYAQKLIVE